MPAKQKNNIDRPRSVLITRFSALGDVAMAIPVVYSVCHANPLTQFVMVTAAPLKSLFLNPPPNLTVVEADIRGKYSGPVGLARLTVELIRDYGITHLADLHNVIRTRIMRLTAAVTAGVKVAVIDKGRADKRRLTDPKSRKLVPLPSSAERYARVFASLGFEISDSFRSLWEDTGADPALFAAVTSPKAPEERWVGIAPFAAHKGKVYPAERMERVVELLSADPSVRIFLFGGGGREREILESWASRYPRVTSLAGRRLGFEVELSLMAFLDCMLAMDSGNAHLAAVAGCPVVSVWGATHPFAGFTAWRQQPSDIIQAQVDCRPCSVFGNKPCRYGDYRCFAPITPEEVAAAVRRHFPARDSVTEPTNKKQS